MRAPMRASPMPCHHASAPMRAIRALSSAMCAHVWVTCSHRVSGASSVLGAPARARQPGVRPEDIAGLKNVGVSA